MIRDTCESAECTGKANNGEGLNCKYVAGQCVEKPANEAQSRTTTGTTGTGSSSIATSTTGSSTNCRPTPLIFLKLLKKSLHLTLLKLATNATTK